MIGSGPAARPTGPARGSGGQLIGDDALAAADAIIGRLSREFPAHASRDLQDMERAAARISIGGDAADSHYREISRLAHDIRGQGAVFGYPLLSRLADTLCQATRMLSAQDRAAAVIVNSHVAGMRAVLDQRITGTENRAALTIAAALELLVRSRLPH
ncbi:MAG: Hpt domain-containing protein [Rhodospirillales bacterium]|nr:MAG: Hpt domain-containing protein [Rhodospirillales bacterium]